MTSQSQLQHKATSGHRLHYSLRILLVSVALASVVLAAWTKYPLYRAYRLKQAILQNRPSDVHIANVNDVTIYPAGSLYVTIPLGNGHNNTHRVGALHALEDAAIRIKKRSLGDLICQRAKFAFVPTAESSRWRYFEFTIENTITITHVPPIFQIRK